MVDPNLTEAQIRALIPARCFRPNVWRSMSYLVFDLILIAACYVALANVTAWYFEWPLIFMVGTLCWSIFVIGHDAGHGAFSRNRTLNTIVGILTHSAILVPYRGWQRSHALHHMKTGHFREEEVFRPCRAEEDRAFRKILFRSGIFVLIGWPMYKLGFRNLTTYDPIKGSHYLPVSDLYTKSVRASWMLGLLALAGFLSFYIGLGMTFGWGFFAKYILAPYLIYGAWLTFVTYMQHVSPEVPIYDTGDWTRMKGALASVDRNYGPFNWLTHNIGNLHVIHHLCPTIPHYRMQEAINAVRTELGEAYLKSDKFVLLDFARTLIGCHYVEHGDGMEVYKSAYGFAKNRGRNGKPEQATVE